MLKHLTLVVELIQQKRKFICIYGTVVSQVNNSTSLVATGLVCIQIKLKFINKWIYICNENQAPDDESLVKFARFLSEKKLSLIEMFRVKDL
jgi:hypothetical protein